MSRAHRWKHGRVRWRTMPLSSIVPIVHLLRILAIKVVALQGCRLKSQSLLSIDLNRLEAAAGTLTCILLPKLCANVISNAVRPHLLIYIRRRIGRLLRPGPGPTLTVAHIKSQHMHKLLIASMIQKVKLRL